MSIMDTKYLVRKVETCPVCHGEKFFENGEWARLNEAFCAWQDEHGKTRMDDEAYAEWDRLRKEQWPWGPEPPEEEPCHECEGRGEVEHWVPLLDALVYMGVIGGV